MSVTTWSIDASHSLAEFAIKHLMIATVKGRFAAITGTVQLDPREIESAVFDVAMDVKSIDTRDAQRDGHLLSPDFFDAEQYPQITFKSRRVEKDGDNYRLVGELTMHGVTKTVAWALSYEGTGKDPWGNTRIGFGAEAKINRKDWGLNWNAALETGGILVGEEVKLSVQIEAIQQA